jgi:hypothetical protein
MLASLFRAPQIPLAARSFLLRLSVSIATVSIVGIYRHYINTASVLYIEMILQLEHWHLGYSQILRDAREQDGSVWILCNSNADALAAARILAYMLRNDGIHYQLRPCTNYSKLKELAEHGTIENVSAMILLNLGASKNRTRFASPDCRIFVMDCCRPFHLANVHARQNVVLFWDQNNVENPSDGQMEII